MTPFYILFAEKLKLKLKNPFSKIKSGKRNFSTLGFKLPLLILAAALSFSFSAKSQAPIIIKNIGMPSGNANCTGVAYGNNVYIAVLSGGYIYQSSDGDNWSKVIDAGIPAGTFNSVSFGAGVFVVVGNNGLILSSANGLNWTSRTASTTNNLFNIGFFQSAFYAVGYNATIRRSTDGITWSSITPGAGTATDMFLSVTYGNSVIVISARSSNGSGSLIYKSATGLSNSWTLQNLNIGTLNRVQYINDRFFAFTAGHQINTSTNANTWTDVTSSVTLSLPNSTTGTWNSSNQIFNGFYDGTKYHFFGSSQYYGGYGSSWTATTGLNLTLQTKSAYIVPQSSAYLNGKYFQTGNEGIVSSGNGITYKYPSGNYYGFASSGTSYVGVGIVGGGIIYTSPDFITWTEKTPANQKELYGVVYNGTKYLAAGANTVIESTDNGNTWSQIATPTDTYLSLAWGSNKFVAAGYDNTTAKIAYSTTGTTWTTANTANNYYFRIKYVNGNFFALGSDNTNYLGVIMHSTDGLTWTDITPNLSFPVYYFNDVVYDGSKYHFMGMEFIDPVNFIYDDFFSVSTATVTNPNSFSNKGTIVAPPVGAKLGGDWGNGAFAYSNGRFVGAVNDVVTGNAYVIYSLDGISWTASALNETTIIGGALASGNEFKLLGTGDGKISVSFSSPLAVSLLQFDGLPVNGQSLLKWQTGSEQNSKEFIVQHKDNRSGWKNIGIVQAAGTSSSGRQYAFTHNNPSKGINNYRLLLNDTDGRTTYSKIINVIFNSPAKQLIAYPNPVVDGKLFLQLQQAATVNVYNSTGALVLRKQLPPGTQQLELTGLSKGVYRVKAGDATTQIVVQ